MRRGHRIPRAGSVGRPCSCRAALRRSWGETLCLHPLSGLPTPRLLRRFRTRSPSELETDPRLAGSDHITPLPHLDPLALSGPRRIRIPAQRKTRPKADKHTERPGNAKKGAHPRRHHEIEPGLVIVLVEAESAHAEPSDALTD